jgi:endonuclease YncB( thermonuclease family)
MTVPSWQAAARRQLAIAAALALLVAMLAFATGRHAPRWEEQAAALPPPAAARAAPPSGTAPTERSARRPIGPGLRPSPEKLLPVDHSSFGRTAKPPAEPPPVEPAPALEDTTPREVLLPRPIVLDAGSFRVGSGTVRLPGIELPTETCGDGASPWPCGARARTALRALVRSRSITCTVPGNFQAKDETVESACSLGAADIGEWLVANGWAKAAAGGPYAEAETRARDARTGIWTARDPSAREASTPRADLPAPPQ